MREIGVYAIVARPGGGKSLYMAWLSRYLLTKEYPRRRRRYPDLPERYILTNAFILPPSPEFLIDVKYWNEAQDLRFCHRKKCWKDDKPHMVHDADIFIDEISNLIPAEDWSLTPYWLRDLFSQHRKRGNRIWACGQAYKGFFNIHVRRMCRGVYMPYIMFKSRDISATLPAPAWVHGIVFVPEYDPLQIESMFEGENQIKELEEVKPAFTLPRIFFLTRSLVAWYNTTQEFPRVYSQKMEEFIQECIHGENCADPRHKIKVLHRPI